MESSPCNPSGRVCPDASPTTTRNPEVVSTPEIQRWMTSIEAYLSEVCSIAMESKLNSDQKMKISNLCRKIGHGTSQIAVQYQSVKQKVLQAYDEIDALKGQHNLSDHISEIKECIQKSRNAGNISFADMVKKGTNDYVRPNCLSSVAIYPSDKQKSSDDTKNLVQKIIRPEQMKLQVRGVRKTRNGGVIISTETKQDAEKLKTAVQLSSSGLTADEPYKRKPRIVVIGVPATLSDSEVFKYIYEQNIADKFPALSLESFLTCAKLSHKSGKKDSSTCNFIVEVPADIRKALILQARIFINWTSCPVRDFTLVTRCYKCQQYGHAAKSCRDASPTCGHCGEVGHSMSECAKHDSPKCATCWRFKKPSNHKTGDVECPAKKYAEQRYINSIDYKVA